MKHNIFKACIFLALFFVLGNIMAQQDTNYTFYRYTMNIVNPAFAGAEDKTEFAVNLRSQWAGVEGAPETQSFMASTYLGKNSGLGISVVNDQTFIETQTAIAIDYSYMIQWNSTAQVYFGVKASGNSYNANTAGLMTFGFDSDPSLMDIDGGITPNIGAGIYVKNKQLSLAFSAPKLLKPKRLEQDGETAKLGRNNMHLYFMSAYDFKLSENFMFKPSTMMRYIENAPMSLDITMGLKFNSIFEFGPVYRVNEGYAGYVLFNPKDSFFIGYAYEAPFHSSLNNTSNGSHEILLKLSL